jgi:hypothetical protein
MSDAKRPRGRPRGTGKDDTTYLQQVAGLLVRDPTLKPTTAMKRVMASRSWAETEPTLIRRWQSKWQRDRANFLAAEQERIKPRRTLRERIAAIGSGQLTQVEREQLCQLSSIAADSIRGMLLTPQIEQALKSLDSLKPVLLPNGFAESIAAMSPSIIRMSEEMVHLQSALAGQLAALKDIAQVRFAFPNLSPLGKSQG